MLRFRHFIVEREMAWDLALQTLGLSATFTAAELDSAFQKALQLYHPDRPGGSHEKMAQANAARDALQNRTGHTQHATTTAPTPARPQAPAGTIRAQIFKALDAYDRRRRNKPSYNVHASRLYHEAGEAAMVDIEQGVPLRRALFNHFNDTLLDAILKAVGEPKAVRWERP